MLLRRNALKFKKINGYLSSKSLVKSPPSYRMTVWVSEPLGRKDYFRFRMLDITVFLGRDKDLCRFESCPGLE